VLKQKLDRKGVFYSVNDSVEEMLDMGITNVPMLSVFGKLLNFTEAIEWVNKISYRGVN